MVVEKGGDAGMSGQIRDSPFFFLRGEMGGENFKGMKIANFRVSYFWIRTSVHTFDCTPFDYTPFYTFDSFVKLSNSSICGRNLLFLLCWFLLHQATGYIGLDVIHRSWGGVSTPHGLTIEQY